MEKSDTGLLTILSQSFVPSVTWQMVMGHHRKDQNSSYSVNWYVRTASENNWMLVNKFNYLCSLLDCVFLPSERSTCDQKMEPLADWYDNCDCVIKRNFANFVIVVVFLNFTATTWYILDMRINCGRQKRWGITLLSAYTQMVGVI